MERGAWHDGVPVQHPPAVLVADGIPGVYPLCCAPHHGAIAKGTHRHPLPPPTHEDMGPNAVLGGGLHVNQGGERALPSVQSAQPPQSKIPS